MTKPFPDIQKLKANYNGMDIGKGVPKMPANIPANKHTTSSYAPKQK